VIDPDGAQFIIGASRCLTEDQTSLGPQGYFHRQDTEKQMAAYSTQVVSVGTEENDVTG
jgi:hypothetical protein